tara:strand:- start:458 stop:784 length:327 start_codon:yes stop_codon:yes gene_type:complete
MNLKTIKMDDHSLIIGITALVSAFGIKEVWSLISKRMDIGAKKNEREDSLYAKQVEILSNKIQQLEVKIELLIEENIQLRVKVVKMESRLVINAKKRTQTRRKKDERN